MLTPDEFDEAMRLLQQLQVGPSQQFLTDDRLHEFYQHAKEWASEIITKDNDEVRMVFFVHMRHRDKETWDVYPILFGDWPPPEHIGKQKALMGLGARFHHDFPDYMPLLVIHVTEMWLSLKPLDTDLSTVTAPSKDPERIESLAVHATSMDQRIDYSLQKIVRDGKKKATLEPIMEHIHDPQKPADPRIERNNLILYFFMGYFASLEHAK